ncbi:hypothetical protein J31TS4_12060 [Paenibacillus sp. J31TS4]|uniref:YqzE family protein n=1 Tax=Paenibacillus sp. J31TS4 TaxID=2807195 RepID=UPI001B2D5AB4|nr:YqzE family protein [Paenibacillus sp. J31TS4]GIP37926.1 hypothetical protein J31TS4_12060 [Paenibacillus sp. J31TS4]
MGKKTDEFVQYLTERVVVYIDTPREVRRQLRQERRSRYKEPWPLRWFGLLPYALSMWISQRKRRSRGRS